MEEGAVDFFLSEISSPFRENNYVIVFPFPFNIFMSLTNLLPF